MRLGGLVSGDESRKFVPTQNVRGLEEGQMRSE